MSTFNTTTQTSRPNPKHAAHQAMLADHREIKEAASIRARTYRPGWHKDNAELCSDKSIDWVSLSVKSSRR